MHAQGAQAFPVEIYFFRHDWPKVTFKLKMIGKPKPVFSIKEAKRHHGSSQVPSYQDTCGGSKSGSGLSLALELLQGQNCVQVRTVSREASLSEWEEARRAGQIWAALKIAQCPLSLSGNCPWYIQAPGSCTDLVRKVLGPCPECTDLALPWPMYVLLAWWPSVSHLLTMSPYHLLVFLPKAYLPV